MEGINLGGLLLLVGSVVVVIFVGPLLLGMSKSMDLAKTKKDRELKTTRGKLSAVLSMIFFFSIIIMLFIFPDIIKAIIRAFKN